MSIINPNAASPFSTGSPSENPSVQPDEADVEEFARALQHTPVPANPGGSNKDSDIDPSPLREFDPRDGFMPVQLKSGSFLSASTEKPVDLDNYKAEKPAVPTPEEKPSRFWSSLQSEFKKGLEQIKKFVASPELAEFARVANIVFAGAMIVASGVLIATGVGAPAGIAALALAGASGLVMQLPAVHDKLQAGVVAMMSPVLGQQNAEKLGPLVTQGLITGLMVAIVATGGSAETAQGALDAAVGVFNNMKDVFSGITEFYQSASPVLEMFGVDIDSKSLQDMAGVFGMMGAMMPDLSAFTKSLGSSLKDFLAKPDIDALKKFMATVKDAPESLTKLIDSDFLKNIGSILEAGEQFLADIQKNDIIQNMFTLIELISEGPKLSQA